MPTRLRTILGALALALVSWVSLPAATTFMPIDDVRAGMTGVGWTVFSGETREEFKVHILGVLRNIMGPQRNLILARLEGGPLADTGVIAGMSGSPVYVDGKLVGAVSYSLGSFPKEPIAGITPIGEMVEATASAPRADATRVKLDLPLTPERVRTALASAFARVPPFAAAADDLEVFGLPRAAGADLGLQLRPIATPFVMSGFSGAPADLLRAAGFAQGDPAQAAPAAGETLQPGDAVGVSLLSGDFELGATGTVTYVDGTRVYAFGHPFFNLGPIAFPMTRAQIYSLLPSYMSSQKIAGLGPVVGSVEQDRATAIAGRLGAPPRLIPITVALASDRGFTRTFHFEAVEDDFFTPLLTYLAVANTLTSYERQVGTSTFSIDGTASVAGHAPVHFANVFAGANALSTASTYVAGPVTLLLGNDLGPVRIESVDLAIRASERPLTATIERVWLDAVRPRAGQTVPVKVLVRAYGGADHVYTVPVAIPANAPSSLTLLVSDAAALSAWEAREGRRSENVTSVDQLIRAINEQRRNDRLYVRLIGPDAGAVVNGEALPSLPPSVLSVLEADRDGGAYAGLRSAVLGAWEVPTGQALTGSRRLTITLERNRP